MMKRLLFCALSALFAFSASAIQKGDYVYTPQGRFLITGDNNLMGNAGSFANLDGWEVVTASEKTLADNFTVGTDGDVAYAQSLVSTVGEGMKYTNSSLDANTTYVISWKLRNAAETAPTRPLTTAINATHAGAGNLVTVTGTNATDAVTYNKADEISSDWVTYCYAIVGDGTSRTLDISLTAMNKDVQIADIQILQAQQVADDRDAEAKAEFIKSIYDLTDWSRFDDEAGGIYPAENLITAYGQVAKITDEMYFYMSEIAGYEAEEIAAACPGFTDDYATYNQQIAKYNDQYDTFKSTQLTAYIDVTKETGEHLGQNPGNNQKINPIGTWSVISPSGRGYWRKGWVDLGHYAGSTNFSEAELSKEFTLFEGGYTFKADFVGVSRPTTGSGDWNTNYGLTSDDAFVFVTDAEGNVIASSDTTGTATDIDGTWTTKYVTFNIPADGKYTMHMKAIRRYNTNGGQVYFRWPELYGKAFGKYTAEEKMYIAAVQEQITAGDNAYAEALVNIDSTFVWGKATLQACVDSMTAKKIMWDAMYDQEDAIVATFDKDVYEPGATNPNSLMVYEVYSTYVKDLLAANKKIKAVNDTLNTLSAKITDAEKLKALTIYQISSGMTTLEDEIATAQQLDAALRADDYSVENAQAIRDEIAALETAMTELKNGIDPTKYTTVYSDIDFEKKSVLYDNVIFEEGWAEGDAATIVGKVGSMEVPSFKKVSESGTSFPYELGIDAEGGYKDLDGVLRVGGSAATVDFNPADLGKNVIIISMDWWFGRLTSAELGFQVLDEDNQQIAGLKFSQYDASFGSASYDTFGAKDNISNFFVGTTAGDAGFYVDANHTHWDVVLDYANMKQYIIATTPKGTAFTAPVDINPDLTMPVSFQVTSSGFKSYPGRRSWFDNLKIQKLELNATTIKGDANGDGEVNITDVSWVLDDINGIENEGFNKEAADVNNDGEVNITDVALILDIINGEN